MRSTLARRLPSDARPIGPSRNSLRPLCGLRSDNRDESVDGRALRARADRPALLGASQARSWQPAPPDRDLIDAASDRGRPSLMGRGGVRSNVFESPSLLAHGEDASPSDVRYGHLNLSELNNPTPDSVARAEAGGERQVVAGGHPCGAARSAGAGLACVARLVPLTRRVCLNEARVASVVSYAARSRPEHRSGPGAQRRALRWDERRTSPAAHARTAAHVNTLESLQ